MYTKCCWCGRGFDSWTGLAAYCSPKCSGEAAEAMGSVGGGIQIDVTDVVKEIASLFGKRDNKDALPTSASVAGSPKPPTTASPQSDPTMDQHQQPGDGKQDGSAKRTSFRERFAKIRNTINCQIEEAKAKNAAIVEQIRRGTPTSGNVNDERRNPASQNILDAIERLGQMVDKGYITREEFEEKKTKLLERL